MASFDITQQSFGGGEITSALQSREDLAKQHVSVKTALNAIITSIGSIKNRPGFEYIAEVEDSTKQHRVIPFVFSREASYCTVWGDEVLRIIKNGAVVGPDVVSPYASTNNADLYYDQSADVMWLTNPIFAPYELTRTSDILWTLTKHAFQDGPYVEFEEGDDEITLTPTAKTGSGVTITTTDAAAFATVVVGDHIRLGYENPFDISIIEWGWATVTGIGSATTRVVTIEKDLGYEFLFNPEFTNDTGFWEDRSTAPAAVTHDNVNKRMVLTKGGGGEDAHTTQEVTVPKYERMTIEIVVDVVDTQIRLRVGNTYAAADVLAEQIITTPGTYSYTTLVGQPTTSTVFVYLDTGGAPASSVHAVSRFSLMRRGLGTPHWRVSAINSDRGFPHVVALFEERLGFYGGHIDNPDTGWLSKIGAYDTHEFNTPPFDTDAVSFKLQSGQVDNINFVAAHGELVIGTDGAEWRVSPGPTSNTITPTSVVAKNKSKRGSAGVKPLIVGDSLLFLGRNSNKIYALSYSFDADSFKPIDLTVLAPHLFDGYTITEWAYQATPDSLVWCVRSDGAMLTLSYVEEQDLWAWSKHTTDGNFESVCVVPEVGNDTVYVEVKRTINGTTKRYIEKLKTRINDEDIYDWYFVDSGKSVDNPLTITNITKADPGKVTITAHGLSNGDLVRIVKVEGMTEVNNTVYQVKNKTANDFDLGNRFSGADIDTSAFTAYVEGGEARLMVSSVTGLSHLEAKTVSVLADGAVESHVVSSGSITLDKPASLIHVGLAYNTDIKTLPHDFVAANGSTSQGKTKKLVKANIYFNKTRSASIGSSEDSTLYPISFNVADQRDAPAPLFTGVKEKKIESGYKKLEHTFLRNSDPVPLEVMGLISEVDFGKK
jgi:hypothetical protein